jgi:hypothetical protein
MDIKLRKFKIGLLVCISFCILLSCDPGSSLNYVITNKTASPLKIQYQFPGGLLVHIDSIAAGSSKIINEERRLGYVDDINRRLDSISYYTFIVKQGDKISHVNFKDKKLWKFEKENHQKATYTLVVSDSLFTNNEVLE